MGGLRHNVSYAQDEKHLFDFIESKRGKSIYIKDLIEEAWKNESKKEIQSDRPKLLDF